MRKPDSSSWVQALYPLTHLCSLRTPASPGTWIPGSPEKLRKGSVCGWHESLSPWELEHNLSHPISLVCLILFCFFYWRIPNVWLEEQAETSLLMVTQKKTWMKAVQIHLRPLLIEFTFRIPLCFLGVPVPSLRLPAERVVAVSAEIKDFIHCKF